MKKIFVLVALILCTILIFGFASCQAKNTIKIGIYEPLTGMDAAGGLLELEGIRLAHQLYPTVEVGGKTYTIKLIEEDNKSDMDEAAAAVQRLIKKHKVNVILGSWGSSLSIAGGKVAQHKVPVIGISCTNPQVTAGNDWYFRVCFTDRFQGTVMANYAYNELGARTAIVVHEMGNEDDYSVGLARYFTNHFKTLTGDQNAVLSIISYNIGDTDFSGKLTTVRVLRPDVIFIPGNYAESAQFIKQAREMGINQTPMLGGDAWETHEFIALGGDRVEGATFSTFFTTEYAGTPQAEIFLEEYGKRYSDDPASDTALGYDGYLLALDAIQRAGSTEPAKIRDALAKTTGFAGATGIVTLDESGSTAKSAYIKTVENGRFVFKTVVEP